MQPKILCTTISNVAQATLLKNFQKENLLLTKKWMLLSFIIKTFWGNKGIFTKPVYVSKYFIEKGGAHFREVPQIGFLILHDVFPEQWHHHSNSSRMSGISLKFGGIMNSAVKPITNWNGHAWLILHVPQKFEIFQCRLQPGLGTLYCFNLLRILNICLKFGGVTHNKIVIWNDHVQPIFTHSTELWNFPW